MVSIVKGENAMTEHTKINSAVVDKEDACFGIGNSFWRMRNIPKADQCQQNV